MPDESSTFGLNREKLSKLWKMGDDIIHDEEEAEETDAETRKAELLQDRLAESVPLNAGMRDMLPDVFNVVCENLRPFADCSFGDLLADPQTDLSMLESIKDLHKEQAQSATSDLAREMASIIYYMAIASALVHHHSRITKFSYEDLAQTFVELSERKWLLPDIVSLFRRAYDHCIKRRET